jgi:hypothetical protein
MVGWLFTSALVAIVAFILVRGGAEERVAAVTIMVGAFSTAAIYVIVGRDFARLQLPFLANELAILVVLLVIAYRSKRFWPLPVAATQVAACLSLLTPSLGADIVSYGLGVTQGLWAYLQLALLILAVVRGRGRRRANTTRSED